MPSLLTEYLFVFYKLLLLFFLLFISDLYNVFVKTAIVFTSYGVGCGKSLSPVPAV